MRVRLPLGTDQVAGGPKHWHAITKNSRERAEREERLTHFHLIDEAAAACLAEPNPEKLKEKLYQLLIETMDTICDTSEKTNTVENTVFVYQGVIDKALEWMRSRTDSHAVK